MANIQRALEFLRAQWASAPDWSKGEHPGQACGSEYQALASSLSIPCPPELVVLGDALVEMSIWVGPWELGDPTAARADRAHLVALTANAPCLAPRSAMLPLFGRDGDLLLLDGVGAVWCFSHDTFAYDHGMVAPSLDVLLGRLLDGPEIPYGNIWRTDWLHVDGVEYQYSIGHDHPGGHCATTLVVDLAPHRIRPRGPHYFIIKFTEPPLAAPRVEPIGIVQVGGRARSLDAATITALVRVARTRGWTGLAGSLDLGEGTALLEELERHGA